VAKKAIWVRPKIKAEYLSKRLSFRGVEFDLDILTSRYRRGMLSSIPHEEQEINPTRSARSMSNLDVELDVRPERP
jgi:hypothetical protein